MSTGLCGCGCGRTTTIALYSDAKNGYVSGLPRPFVRGHNSRRKLVDFVRPDGYAMTFLPSHPRANNEGYVLAHVVVVERAVGRELPVSVVVHHVNQIRSDNRPSNLAVLAGHGEHAELHRRLRVLRAGGNPWTDRLCSVCKVPKVSTEFYKACPYTCKDCQRKSTRDRSRAKRQSAAA